MIAFTTIDSVERQCGLMVNPISYLHNVSLDM